MVPKNICEDVMILPILQLLKVFDVNAASKGRRAVIKLEKPVGK
jgi:hypothetical protein